MPVDSSPYRGTSLPPSVQGYLAHKKPPPPLRSPYVPRNISAVGLRGATCTRRALRYIEGVMPVERSPSCSRVSGVSNDTVIDPGLVAVRFSLFMGASGEVPRGENSGPNRSRISLSILEYTKTHNYDTLHISLRFVEGVMPVQSSPSYVRVSGINQLSNFSFSQLSYQELFSTDGSCRKHRSLRHELTD